MSLRLLLLREVFSAHRLRLAPRLSRADGQNIFPGYKNICSSCTALRFVRHSLENVLGKGQNSRRTWPRCVVRGPIRIQQAEIDWTSWPYCCGVSGTQSSSHREICFAPRGGGVRSMLSGCCSLALMPRGLRSFLFEKRRYAFSLDSAGFALENYPPSIIGASEFAGIRRSAIDRLVERRVNLPRRDLERRCRSRSCPERHDR